MGIVQTHIQIGDQDVRHFMLTNQHGMVVELMNWGATLADVCTADRHGVVESVTLAHEAIDSYRENGPYFGCIVGRVAGRIAHGRFHLNGTDHQLPNNQGEHHLHGGASAMSYQVWQVGAVGESEQGLSVTFHYRSVADENAYPGTLDVTVTYTLNDDNQLTVDYQANTDAPTLCNLTHHAYFNLSGNTQRTVHDHVLQVQASAVCEMDADLLVTGGEWPVANSDFDFRAPRTLDATLRSDDVRLALARGIDHYFVLDDVTAHQPQVVVLDGLSGRRLQVFTDQPCVVLYAHNYAGNEALRHGVVGQSHDALCIETQKLPHRSASNGDHAAALYPNQIYRQHTRFCFDVV